MGAILALSLGLSACAETVVTRVPDLPKVASALMRTPAKPLCDLETGKAFYSGPELEARDRCKDAVIALRDKHIAGLQRAIRVREKAVAAAVGAAGKP